MDVWTWLLFGPRSCLDPVAVWTQLLVLFGTGPIWDSKLFFFIDVCVHAAGRLDLTVIPNEAVNNQTSKR